MPSVRPRKKSLAVLTVLALVFTVLPLAVLPAVAATTLSPGDLALIGVNSDNPDEFAFVLLVPIDAGTEIRFTDSGWESDDTFRANEGAVKYTAPTALSAGAVINSVTNAADFAADNDTGVGTSGFALSASGDQVFAFQGSSTSPSFIFAVQTNSTQFQSTATASTNSALPTGLTVGTSAVAVGSGPGAGDEWDNSAYDSSVTSGDQPTLLAAIANSANWNGNNSRISPLPAGPFTVGGDAGPAVASTDPANGATDVALDTNIVIEFTEPVNVADPWFGISCATAGSVAATVSGGPVTFTLDPGVDLLAEDSCVVTVLASQVTDQDSDDPPDEMAADYLFSFATRIGACFDPATFIHDVQGPGLVSPLVGQTVTVEAVVVGDFEASDELDGFFLQEEDAEVDGDPATSEGIFVFNEGFGPGVSPGDLVRVRGTVEEFFAFTRLNAITGLGVCGPEVSPTPGSVTLPVSDVDDWEPTEGMLVNIPQTLYASGNFTQGRFGEVDLSIGGPLENPTNVVAPGAAANALQDLNNRSRIQLDDGSNVQNPLPLPPYLGLNNTLRTGDTLPGITAALGYAFGVYELQPTGGVSFSRENPRLDPPAVGGSLEIAAFNVLNYFTTIDNAGPICGPNGDQGCRGADTPGELVRQRDKIVTALAKLDADVVGLIEIENPRLSATVDEALDDLVNGPSGLNSVVGAGTYDYIDTGTIGSDAIKVALIYKPAAVETVGGYAILDSSVDPTFNDTRNRPALAQSFREIGTDDIVTVAVNHLKSKGSDCDDLGDPDTGDGQGNCNLTRTSAATALANWLATDPTGSGSPDNLVIGDLNAYAMEDPVVALESANYTDLIESFVGTGWAAGAYSFNFFSQSGYLDHGLASPSVLPKVTGAAFWHINADEPSALDYNNFNQPALYNPDEFRASDHDPVVVGLCETTSPVVEVTASPDTLWPPNHKYVDVTATVDVTDADPNATVTLMSVTSNEPDNGLGDGDTPNDIVIVDDFSFQLRAERSGTGNGRVYTITYDVTDSCGNTTLASATVTVPKSKGKGK